MTSPVVMVQEVIPNAAVCHAAAAASAAARPHPMADVAPGSLVVPTPALLRLCLCHQVYHRLIVLEVQLVDRGVEVELSGREARETTDADAAVPWLDVVAVVAEAVGARVRPSRRVAVPVRRWRQRALLWVQAAMRLQRLLHRHVTAHAIALVTVAVNGHSRHGKKRRAQAAPSPPPPSCLHTSCCFR